MAHISLLLIFYQFIWLIQSIHSWNKPLIFNPYTLEIHDVGDTLMTYKGGSYIVACPAADQQERNFDESYSLNHKSLFLRHFDKIKPEYVYRIRCQQSVELAVAYYANSKSETEPKYLKFGYEVYFVSSYFLESFNEELLYSNFEKVLKPVKERFDNFFFGSPKIPKLAKEGSEKLLEMGFIWISKATLQFDESQWRAHNMSYSIHKKVDRPVEKCKDFALLNELLGNKSIDDFYTPNHQENIFKSVELQENDCESKYYCVQKYSLVPAYQFETNQSVSCTNLTTVPVWSKTTAPLLDHLDRFLFAIAQVTYKKLTVYPFTHDILTLPKINSKGSKLKSVYLYPRKKKLAIPKVIFKLVVYKTHRCDRNITLCWFQAIIVIHNEPKITQKPYCEDKCSEWGWESIQYPDENNPQNKSELIYCCEMNEELQNVLTGSTTETYKYRNLNLKEFPTFNRIAEEHKYESKLERISDKMIQLFGDGKSSMKANSWFPLPPTEDIKFLYL